MEEHRLTLLERKRQEHECLRKVRHTFRREAIDAVRSMRQKSRDQLRAYHCSWCDGYHIGHKLPAHMVTNLRSIRTQSIRTQSLRLVQGESTD